MQRDFSVVFKCQSPQLRRFLSPRVAGLGSSKRPCSGDSQSAGSPVAGSWLPRAGGTQGFPQPRRAVVAVGTRALVGADGAGVGTKARTLKFKSSESGPRAVCFNCLRLNVRRFFRLSLWWANLVALFFLIRGAEWRGDVLYFYFSSRGCHF